MNFNYLENRSGGENIEVYKLASLLGLVMANLYDENENEEYRQALKDVSFKLCEYLEPQGISLNRTPLTVDWMDSNTRRDLRRAGWIK